MRLLPVLLSVLWCGGCVGPKRIDRADKQVTLAAAYYRENNPEASIEALRRARELDPRNWRAANLLGVTYLAKGLPDEAEAEFKRALRINPGEAEILVNVGAMQIRQGNPEAAVETFSTALKDLDYRNVAVVLSNLSLAYTESGDYEQAAKSASEATRRAPTLCQGWFHLGIAHERRGDADSAFDAYRGMIENCPNQAEGAEVRVACLQVKGETPELGREALVSLIERTRGTPLGDEARACLTGS